jgi:ribose transport system substrate-binding protein
VSKKLPVIAVTLAAAFGVAACGSSSGGGSTSSGSTSAGASTTSGGAQSDPQKIAYSSPVAAQPGQRDIAFGFQAAAKGLGWSSSILDANLSADKQVSDIATMVTQKVNGIASWTLDPGAAAGAYGQAQSANIPVIGVNSVGTGVTATVWWELNRCTPDGPVARTAQYIARARAGARVIVIAGPPVPSIQAYVTCFRAAARTAGLNVIAETANTRDSSAAAQPIASDLLTKHPDVDAFWNYNDASALGVSAAIAAANKKVYTDATRSGIIDTGQNGDSDAIAAVRAGRMTGTWDSDPVATGWAMTRLLSDYIGAKRMSSPPRELVVRSEFWTSSNIARYVAPHARPYTLENLPLVGAAG